MKSVGIEYSRWYFPTTASVSAVGSVQHSPVSVATYSLDTGDGYSELLRSTTGIVATRLWGTTDVLYISTYLMAYGSASTPPCLKLTSRSIT